MNDEVWRLFVALPIPDEVKELCRAAQQHLRSRQLSVRWVDQELAHITLKFLGDTKRQQIDALADQLGEAAVSQRAFDLTTARLGAFPNNRAPHTLWMGLEGDVQAIQDLAEAVDLAAADAGYEHERRVYRPHITLGRWRYGAGKPRDITEDLESMTVPAVTFRIEHVHLIRSTLRSTGPEYTVIADWSLTR